LIEISPNGLYSRQDLAELLRPFGLDADHFIGRLRPRKVFRSCWLGSDLLAALRDAPALDDRRRAVPEPRGRGGRRGRAGATPALDGLIERCE
jgi:hypothetical protein